VNNQGYKNDQQRTSLLEDKDTRKKIIFYLALIVAVSFIFFLFSSNGRIDLVSSLDILHSAINAVLLGAIGGLIRVAYYSYKRRIQVRDKDRYYRRVLYFPIVGALLGLIVYLILLVGLFVIQHTPYVLFASPEKETKIDPIFMSALSILAGYSSRNVITVIRGPVRVEHDREDKIDVGIYMNAKTTLYLAVPALVILMVITGVLFTIHIKELYILNLIASLLISFCITAFIWLSVQNLKKEFRFRFARECIELSTRESDEVKKMRYFKMGIDSYNKFLKRCLNLQISDVNTIFSKIIACSSIENDSSSLLDSFIININNNKLEPLKCLSKRFFEQSIEKLLIEQPLKEKIKNLTVFIIPIITVIISLFGLLMKSGK
jgi:hypothetical protein